VATYTPQFHNAHVLAPPIPGDPSTNPGLAFNPDIVAAFDFARWMRPIVPDGVDPPTATPQELLTFLGASATPPPPTPGDIDLDGDVDRNDAARFAAHFGQTEGASWSTGDFDRDGAATLADWSLLQSNLSSAGPATLAAVPEPRGWALALLAVATVLTHRRLLPT
jgi:hypothetical protein